MISLLLLASTISCEKPRMINLTKESWTMFDHKTVRQAQKRCFEKFRNSPCLKRFIKTKPLAYRAVCGQETIHGRF